MMRKNKRTKLGNMFYDFTCCMGEKLIKHKLLYYLLMFTWGLPLTIVGFLLLLFLLICGKKPKMYHGIIYLQVGKSWGGLSVGMVCVTGKECFDYVINHELGHTFQNCIYGPIMLFLITIPSIIRYWYIELNKNSKSFDYDAIWFEGSATYVGYYKMYYDNKGGEK